VKHQRHYDKLIERARTRPMLEDHHVIPRCMDSMDDPTNLVELMPEEHRIAHLLLAKIYPHNSDLGYAAFLMTMVERYRGRSKRAFRSPRSSRRGSFGLAKFWSMKGKAARRDGARRWHALDRRHHWLDSQDRRAGPRPSRLQWLDVLAR
jgi:hypothetical protein